MKVFVTGSSSRLAAALLPRLCARPGIARVTGVDLRSPRFEHARFSATQLDIRDSRLEALIRDHDSLVHLAGVVSRGRVPDAEMFDINVNGAHKVFHAASRAGVRRLIHLYE